MSTRKLLLLAALFAGCDEDDPVRHLDGGVTIDSPMIDAPVNITPVTLTITVNGAAQEGIVVHFQNADSTLVATEMTDANGKASHVINAGGYVTAVDPFPAAAGLPSTTALRTFAGVKPGDNLKLSDSIGSSNVTMTVTLPVQGDPSITKYTVGSSCTPFPEAFPSTGSGFQPTGPVEFLPTCATADIIATSYNNSGAVVGYFVVAGQTVTANATIDYSSKSYTAPTNRTYTFNNKPGDLYPLAVIERIGLGGGEILKVEGTTSDTLTMGIPTVANGVSVVSAYADSATTNSHHMLFDWGPVSTTAFTTDVGARKLANITAASFDAASHMLSWTEANGAAPEFSYVGLFATRTTTTSTFGVDWYMIAPRTAANAKFPKLPVGAVDYNPDADDIINIGEITLGKVPGGYDAIRANGFLLDEIVSYNRDLVIAMTATGSAELVSYRQLLKELTVKRSPTLRHRVRR
jgi:hypothetical protein